MTTNNNNINPKKPVNFSCELCNFKCSYNKDFQRHINTKKHKNNILTTNNNNINQKKPDTKIYQCENCEKTFNDRAGLWRHKKKCTDMIIDGINIKDKDALVLHLLKQNGELQNKLIELSSEKSITNNTTNNTTNNSFNLNFFLNETCKDAMNITDFVSSIKLNLEDLENTGKQGYIKGISDIIIKKLSNLEQCFRPIHCSDMKREILYIKHNNEWTKETEDKPILTNVIKKVANENIKQIQYWRDKNPDCTDPSLKKNNIYLKIVSNSMNGLTKEEGDNNINKIITNVAKEVIINKNAF